MQTLSDSQAKSIEKLSQYKVGALFMEPGTGKTRSAIELVRSVDKVDYVLWLTPYRTKDNLSMELMKWAFSAHIIGIETLSSSDRTYLELIHRLTLATCPFIVVDESLKIKNWSAKRTQRIIELGRLCEYKLILNGTPLSRNLLDIWAQMQFLSPKILKMSQQQYINTFCEVTRITRNNAGFRSIKEFISGFANVDYLYSLIGHYVFESELSLRQRRYYINVPYTVRHKKEYERIKSHYLCREMMAVLNNNIFLQMVQHLQHSYCADENKLRELGELLSGLDPAHTLIFTKFIDSHKAINVNYPKFRTLTYGKHAYGLNLQQYHKVVFFDKTWDYAQRLQSERRIYRTGQHHDCTYFDMTGDVPLEQLIDRNIGRKIDLLEYFKSTSIDKIQHEL